MDRNVVEIDGSLLEGVNVALCGVSAMYSIVERIEVLVFHMLILKFKIFINLQQLLNLENVFLLVINVHCVWVEFCGILACLGVLVHFSTTLDTYLFPQQSYH